MKYRSTTILKGIVLDNSVWPWRIIKIGGCSAAIAKIEPLTVMSISRERRRILAIRKMLLLDEVKDYLPHQRALFSNVLFGRGVLPNLS